MNTQATMVVLFCVATAIAIVVRRLAIPYTVALVVAGLGLGSLRLVSPPHLTRELLFTLFLPGLLFEAAFHLDRDALRRTWRGVTLLSVPGVALSITITAAITLAGFAVLGSSAGLGWSAAIVFGALVAATDPVAVTALFREIHAPARLTTLVEAESLFNDGTSIVFLGLVLAAVAGGEWSVGAAIPGFALIAGGGLLIGAVVGWAVTRVIHQVDDPMIELALTTIAAFGSFALADGLGLSGVLATVVAGIICASHGRDTAMSPASRAAAEIFWEYMGFALNSIVFLLIGLEVQVSQLAGAWREIVIGFAAMTIARVVMVVLLALVLRPGAERLPRAWSAVLMWGGLRGALSMVLALSLPLTLPHRDALVAMTVGAVVGSLLVQGLTMPVLVRALDIGDGSA